MELWEVPLGRPESEWACLGVCRMGTDEAEEEEGQQEGGEEQGQEGGDDGGDSDDWEASVDSFAVTKPPTKKMGDTEEDWDATGACCSVHPVRFMHRQSRAPSVRAPAACPHPGV